MTPPPCAPTHRARGEGHPRLVHGPDAVVLHPAPLPPLAVLGPGGRPARWPWASGGSPGAGRGVGGHRGAGGFRLLGRPGLVPLIHWGQGEHHSGEHRSGEHRSGEHRSGEPPGVSPGTLRAVPELLGAPWLFSAVPRLSGSWKWKLRVLEPRWRMTGTCGTGRGWRGGSAGGGARGRRGAAPRIPRHVRAPSPTHPCHRVLRGHLQRRVEAGNVLHTRSRAGVGGREPARQDRKSVV